MKRRKQRIFDRMARDMQTIAQAARPCVASQPPSRRPVMKTLTIADLPVVETMDRDAMSAIRGGIAYLTRPDTPGDSPFPGLAPPSSLPYPGGSFFKDLYLPGWPVSPAHPAQDPRLL
jgi:hypothetical protein